MGIRISEDKQLEQQSLQWDKITHSLSPETDDLENEEDKRFFESKIKFLLDKETRLANIPTKHMYYFMEAKNYLFLLEMFPMYTTNGYRLSKFGEHLGDLALTLAENALAWKFGPMGFQHSSIKQEVIQTPELRSEKAL